MIYKTCSKDTEIKFFYLKKKKKKRIEKGLFLLSSTTLKIISIDPLNCKSDINERLKKKINSLVGVK